MSWMAFICKSTQHKPVQVGPQRDIVGTESNSPPAGSSSPLSIMSGVSFEDNVLTGGRYGSVIAFTLFSALDSGFLVDSELMYYFLAF